MSRKKKEPMKVLKLRFETQFDDSITIVTSRPEKALDFCQYGDGDCKISMKVMTAFSPIWIPTADIKKFVFSRKSKRWLIKTSDGRSYLLEK